MRVIKDMFVMLYSPPEVRQYEKLTVAQNTILYEAQTTQVGRSGPWTEKLK